MSEHDPFDISGQELAAADKTAAEKLERQNEVGDFTWLMNNPRGRRIVRRLLAQTGVHRSSFNNSGSVTAFNEGQRNVGLRLMEMINSHCPDQYVLLLNEHKNGQRTSDD